jgi:hypothetical protein
MNAIRRPAENTRLVLAVALVLWGAGVALAGAFGTFANLGPQLGTAIVAFAAVFAIATYYLDRDVHSTVDAIDLRVLAALAAAGLAASAWMALEGAPAQALVHMPRIVVALFVAPVTIAMLVATLDRVAHALARRATSPRTQGKAGGGTPAAAA